MNKGWWVIAALGCAVGLLLLQILVPDLVAPVLVLVIANGIILALWLTPRRSVPLAVPRLVETTQSRQGGLSPRTSVALLCCLGALLLFARSQEFFLSLPFILLSVLLVGVTLWLRPLSIPTLDDPIAVASLRAIRLLPMLLGVVLLWVVAEISGQWLHLPWLTRVPTHVQVLLLVTGIIFVTYGLGGRVRLPYMERRETLLLGGITLLALVLRLVVLDTAIPRFVDELNFVDGVVRLWDAPNTPILVPFGRVATFTWVYPYLQSQVVSLFGNTLFALRLTSVFFGTAAIPALYFLGRVIFGRKIAFIAVLVLATFPAHLHFSRLALNNIADPLFGTLALAFLARGLKHRQRSDMVLAGALLGLTQYFYEGGRLLFPGLLLAWFGLSWLDGRHKRERLVGGLLLLLTALLVALPVYYTLAATGTFTPRFDFMGMLPSSPLASSPERQIFLYFPWLMYTVLPDMSWFYGGAQPMLLGLLAPLFLLGVALLIWRVRSPGALLLVLWVALTSLGNMLLVETAWLPRYVVVFPAVALLLAVGVTYLVDTFWPVFLAQKWRTVLLVVLVSFAAVGQTVYYFRDHLPYFNTQFILSSQADEALLRTTTLPAQTRAHLILPQSVWEFNIKVFMRFWQPPVTIDALYPEQVTPEYLRGQSQNRVAAHAFFIKAGDEETLGKLRQYFTLLPPAYSPYDVDQVTHLVLYYGYAR